MEIELSKIITMFIITLGPVKLLLPFANATANADATLRRTIAIKATLLASAVALVCLLAGDFVVESLHLSPGTLMIAISIFLMTFAFSLAHVGDTARTETAASPSEISAKEMVIFPLAFPGIVPPQGFGLLVLSTQLKYTDASLDGLTLCILLTAGVMVLNVVVMLSARAILATTGRGFWLLLARFLSPLFVALSVHLFLSGLQQAGTW